MCRYAIFIIEKVITRIIYLFRSKRCMRCEENLSKNIKFILRKWTVICICLSQVCIFDFLNILSDDLLESHFQCYNVELSRCHNIDKKYTYHFVFYKWYVIRYTSVRRDNYIRKAGIFLPYSRPGVTLKLN